MSRGRYFHLEKKKKRRHTRSGMYKATGLFGSGGIPYFIFRDEFTTPLTAGNIDGTKSSDGKATRSVTDTESKLSISGERAVFASGKISPSFGDPGIWYPSRARSAGLAAITKLEFSGNSPTHKFGFDSDQRGSPVIGIYAAFANALYDIGGIINISTLAKDTLSNLYVILRNTGALLIQDDKLLWVDNADTTDPVYVGACDYSGENNYMNYIRLAQLPAPFDIDYGLATDRLAGARSAGDTFSHEADFVGEFTVDTLNTGDALRLEFRRVGDDDNWSASINSDGDIKLYEYVSGNPTLRGEGVEVVSNGSRIVVIAEGETIKIYVDNALEITYESASSFKTATAGKLLSLGTGGAVSNIVTYPRTLSGTAASILNRVSK